MTASPTKLPWLVRGDIDGLLGLALDNLVQLLVIVNLCTFVLGFPAELIYGTLFARRRGFVGGGQSFMPGKPGA